MASQDWVEKDFYAILGIAKDASDADIKKAYRKLARQYHPDTNAGDAAAEKKFKDISEAYSVLSSAEDRQQYDAIRAMGGARFAPGAGAGRGGAGLTAGLRTCSVACLVAALVLVSLRAAAAFLRSLPTCLAAASAVPALPGSSVPRRRARTGRLQRPSRLPVPSTAPL